MTKILGPRRSSRHMEFARRLLSGVWVVGLTAGWLAGAAPVLGEMRGPSSGGLDDEQALVRQEVDGRAGRGQDGDAAAGGAILVASGPESGAFVRIGTLADATVAPSDIVEIRLDGLARGGLETLYYFCLERDDLPEAVFDKENFQKVSDEAYSLRKGVHLQFAVKRISVWATTGACLPEVRKNVRSQDFDLERFSVFRLGTLPE